MIFFSATDVGGARAISPVFQELEKHHVPFCMMDEGVLSSESDPSYRRIALPLLETEEAFKSFLLSEGVTVVCFGTAVERRLPIYHSLWAARLGIPSVAVLDNWMNYRQRFVLPDEGEVFPDHYFVMDQLAYDEAVREGIPPEIIEVTGHPGLAELALEAENYEKDDPQIDTSRQLVFISEPAAQDQGSHAGTDTYRGYTEFDVLKHIADFMVGMGSEYELIIAPHPREDRAALQSFCDGLFAPEVRWRFSSYARGRGAVFSADGVIGMTSILLYEAWLLGLPVISLQPGVRGEGASHFLARDGCYCITEFRDCQASLEAWMNEVDARDQGTMHTSDDLGLHRTAPQRVARRLVEISG